MAEVALSTNSQRLPGPSNRDRRRENDDLYIFTISSIDSTDTFTPFGGTAAGTGGVARSIYDWAIKPIDTHDIQLAAASRVPIAVNPGSGVEMTATFTPATTTAAAYFTFTCTAGAGLAQLYVWAK